MTSDPLNIEKYNKSVLNSGFTIRIKLRNNISRLSHRGKKDLVRSLRLKAKKEFGEISELVYQFQRHGVFFHKGVGRGYIMQGGKVVRGSRKASMFKQPTNSGVIRRVPRDWFNPVLNKEVPKLADRIAGIKADHAGETIIKIK